MNQWFVADISGFAGAQMFCKDDQPVSKHLVHNSFSTTERLCGSRRTSGWTSLGCAWSRKLAKGVLWISV